MVFAHPEMLLVAAAVALPLLLHFFRRQRQGEVQWSAMALLRQIVDQHARRRKLHRRLLLFLRCAALVLLALAMADPRLESPALGQKGTAGRQRRDLVVVMDVSMSMSAGRADASRLQDAKRLAVQAVEALQPGDTVWVLVLSDTLRPVFTSPTVDHRRAIAEINSLVAEDTMADMGLLSTSLETMVHSRPLDGGDRRVLILSDLQQETWKSIARSSDASRNDSRDVQVVDVGRNELTNARVDRLVPERFLAVAGQPLEFRAELRAWYAVPPEVQLELLIDGHPVKTLPLQWNLAQRCQATWQWTFDQAGSHQVTVRLPEDTLVADNAQTVVIHVVASIPVWCVYGDRTTATLVSHAIAPQEKGPLKPVMEPLSGWPWTETGPGSVIVLADVATLRDAEYQDLRRRVENGTGLVTVLGPAVQPSSYNHPDSLLLPGRLLQPVDNPEPGLHIADPGDPLVAPFVAGGEATLEGTPVWRYWQLELAPAEGTRVALVSPRQDPVLVWRPLGQGASILLATTSRVDRMSQPGDAWSALAVWPSFVPLMQQSVWHAAAFPFRHRVVEAGEWTNSQTRLPGPQESSTEESTVELSTAVESSGERLGRWRRVTDASGRDATDIALADPATPPRFAGLYVRIDDPQNQSRLLVVPSLRESALQRIAPELVPWSVTKAPSWKPKQQSAAADIPPGPTVAPWLLLGTLVLLLAEQFLTTHPLGGRS